MSLKTDKITSMEEQIQVEHTPESSSQERLRWRPDRLPISPYMVASLAIILLGALIRFHNLAADSFWIDEILTIRDAKLGLDVLETVRDHPPLLYFLSFGVLDLVGENEFLVRLPSLVGGILAIPLMIAFGRVIKWPVAGLIAALLLSLSPAHLRYSQMARHYSLLMLFSLASYIALYLALSRPNARRWLVYAIIVAANMYTHFGSLLVLASQTLLITVWLIGKLYRRQWSVILGPFVAVVAVILLYLPMLGRLASVFFWNVGDSAGRAIRVEDLQVAPIIEWLRLAFVEFGFRDEPLPYLFFALALAGIASLVVKRDWLTFGITLSGMAVPFAMIWLLQIARLPETRYIVHILPMYLLLVGIAFDQMLGLVGQLSGPRSRQTRAVASLLLAGILLLVTLPLIRREYDAAIQDWRGVAEYLDEVAEQGDVIIGVSPTISVNFNMVTSSLPYYLQKSDGDFRYLPSNKLNIENLPNLAELDANVWAVVWNPEGRWGFDSDTISAEYLDYGTYVVNDPGINGSSLEKTIALYEQIVPAADEPFPLCMLKQDQATLEALAGNHDAARDHLDEAVELCPEKPLGVALREKLYRFITLDEIVTQLERVAEDGDVVLGLSLLDSDYLVDAAESIALALDQSALDVIYVPWNDLGGLYDLNNVDARVFVIALSPYESLHSVFSIKYDAGSGDSIVLLHDPGLSGSVHEQMIALLEDQDSAVGSPAAQCAILKTLAILHTADAEYEAADQIMDTVARACPEEKEDIVEWQQSASEMAMANRRSMEQYALSGDERKARAAASALLPADPKNTLALSLLTSTNLMQLFESGSVNIAAEHSPEIVEVRQFVMPHNGDWGDVIFMHPPASASFELDLPEETVTLQSRVATDPQSWSWGGDGVTFVVTIQANGAKPIEIYRQHIGNEAADHKWHDVSVSLAPYAGQGITLTLSTESGPAGDGTGDWAGWETPRLFWDN